MSKLYFQYTTAKSIRFEKTIEYYMPLYMTFQYDAYSDFQNRIEYRTKNFHMYFSFGENLGEITSFTLLFNKTYNFINEDIALEKFLFQKGIPAIKINESYLNELPKRKYLESGLNYMIAEACTVDIYNDGLKITLPNTSSPVFCIMNENFGVLTDIDLNICSFILKGITSVEYADLLDNAKNPT